VQSTTIKNYNMEWNWSEFLGGTTIGYIVKEAISYWKKKNELKVNVAQTTRDIVEIFNIMKHCVSETHFNRFMIFVAEDSAGLIAVGKSIYATALYEWLNPEIEDTKSVISEVQRWRADAEYYEMFCQMLTNGSAELVTREMPVCKLKDLYVSCNVKTSKVFHLMTTKDNSKVFYCSVASSTTETSSPSDRLVIDSSVDKLIEIFRRHKKFY